MSASFTNLSGLQETLAAHLPALWVVGALTLGGATIDTLDGHPGSLGASADAGTASASSPKFAPVERGVAMPAVSDAAGWLNTAQPRPASFPLEVGSVERVIDGDTYEIRLDRTGELARVRLAWMDAPEPPQPFGSEATAWAEGWLLHRRVVLTVQDVDPYGRLVAQLNVDDEGYMWDVGATLARLGLAWLDPRYGSGRASLDEDQARARSEGMGLWEQPNPIPPWEWRRGGKGVGADASAARG